MMWRSAFSTGKTAMAKTAQSASTTPMKKNRPAMNSAISVVTIMR